MIATSSDKAQDNIHSGSMTATSSGKAQDNIHDNTESSNSELGKTMIAAPSSTVQADVEADCSDASGFSDYEDMPGLVRPDEYSDGEGSCFGDVAEDADEDDSHDEEQHEILADSYARLVSIVQGMADENRTMPRGQSSPK